jgi:hypothetical protein
MPKFALFVCGLVVLFCAAAQAKEYTCPERIVVKNNDIVAVHGFETWSNPQAEFFVAGIDLYAGHPRDKVQLKPDNAETPEEADGAMWSLTSGTDYWMDCLYSDTNARMIRQLDIHEGTCAVKDIRGPEDSTSGGGVSLVCK